MQVRPEIDDYHLVRLMQKFGQVVSHRIIRKSGCAFVDFSTIEEAAAARQGLHVPPRSGPCQGIIVEFKVHLLLRSGNVIIKILHVLVPLGLMASMCNSHEVPRLMQNSASHQTCSFCSSIVSMSICSPG